MKIKNLFSTLIFIQFCACAFAQNNYDHLVKSLKVKNKPPPKTISLKENTSINESSSIKRSNKSVYINILGDASVFSFNYESFIFSNGENFHLTAKGGVGFNSEFEFCFFGSCGEPDKFLTIPHHITGLFGNDYQFFEIGLGGTLIPDNNKSYISYPIIGFRSQSLVSNGFNFRLYAQFPFQRNLGILFIPVGLSIGYNFKK